MVGWWMEWGVGATSANCGVFRGVVSAFTEYLCLGDPPLSGKVWRWECYLNN